MQSRCKIYSILYGRKARRTHVIYRAFFYFCCCFSKYLDFIGTFACKSITYNVVSNKFHMFLKRKENKFKIRFSLKSKDFLIGHTVQPCDEASAAETVKHTTLPTKLSTFTHKLK